RGRAAQWPRSGGLPLQPGAALPEAREAKGSHPTHVAVSGADGNPIEITRLICSDPARSDGGLEYRSGPTFARAFAPGEDGGILRLVANSLEPPNGRKHRSPLVLDHAALDHPSGGRGEYRVRRRLQHPE